MKDLATQAQTRESRQTRSFRDPEGTGSIMFPERRLIDLAPGRGGMAVDILRLQDRGLALGRVVSGGHEVALEDPENITILLPVDGQIAVQTEAGEQAFNSGSLILAQAAKRRTRVVAPKGGLFRAVTVQIPRTRLAVPKGPGPADRDIRVLDTGFSRQFGHLLPDLAADIFRQPDRFLSQRAYAEFISLIDGLLLDALGQSVNESGVYGGLREFKRVSQACDIIRARAGEPLSLADLAAELGVTPRTLQLSFQAVHGMSPRKYMQRTRLDRVRACIEAADFDGQVTSAAVDCGFLHLGRFSEIYRRTFGELPSKTLERRRQMPAQTRTQPGK